MNENSLFAYREITKDGKVKTQRDEVYAHLCRHGPKAQFQIRNELSEDHRKRVADLEKLGRVIKLGDIINPETGKRVGVYNAVESGS